VKHPDSPRQLWIRSTRDPNAGTLLYEYARNAAVLFSPDERWLVVNDGAGSNVADVHLFRRVRGIKFVEVQKARVTEQAWHLLFIGFERGRTIAMPRPSVGRQTPERFPCPCAVTENQVSSPIGCVSSTSKSFVYHWTLA
jgi:hypothetical protein